MSISGYSQVNLNYGSYPNDLTADSIYTTFAKCQLNFNSLFQIQANTLTNTNFVTWFQSLPTTLPNAPGVMWNNGGVLCMS